MGVTAQDIVDAARSLKGVRYRFQCASATLGVDCLGLLKVTAQKCGLEYDTPTDYHAINREGWVLELLRAALVESGPGDGKVVVMPITKHVVHLGISTDQGVVEACDAHRNGKVVERVDPHVISHHFEFPGVEY